MKKGITIICIFLCSCFNDAITSKLRVITTNDTISINEKYIAKLCIGNIDLQKMCPKYYIISSTNDTFYLPTNEKNGCAEYRAVGREKGKTDWNGFVDFIDSKGNYQTLPFSGSYYVK